MKKYIILCTILLIALTGCNIVADTVQQELPASSEYEQPPEPLQTLPEESELIEPEVIEPEQPEPPPQEENFYRELTPDEIISLLEGDARFVNFMGDNIPSTRPDWDGFIDRDIVSVSAATISFTMPTAWGDFSATLSYQVDGDTLLWNVDEYVSLWFGPRQKEVFTPRHLTDLEWVTIGFFYYCRETDPYINFLPEAERYHEEVIYGAHLWEEFIRLMRYHHGIRIRDLWYDGARLYVDLAAVEAIVFNWGSTGSFYRWNVLVRTLATLPDVSEIVILVGGYADVEADHYSFRGVFEVN